MKTKQSHSVTFHVKALPYVERFSLALLLLSGVLISLKSRGALELFMVAMGGLGIAFFLRTKIPVEEILEEGAPAGFKGFLVCDVIPKVLWIGAAIFIFGILFHFLGFNSSVQMLAIGVTASAIALAIVAGMLPTAVRHPVTYRPLLIRALPVFAVACYLLLTTVAG